MNCYSKPKQGFTLVELSIVLVIIGILVGGILVADSMIQTTRIQAFVRQIQQFDISVTNFQNKYRSLPGDSKLFTPPGNGDGFVTDPNGNDDNYMGETGAFWAHLSQSGDINENYQAALPAIPSPAVILGVNAPQAKIGNNAAVIVAVSIANPTWDTVLFNGEYKNFYIIAAFGPPELYLGNGHNAVDPVDALAVDQKMDDGLADSGNVKAAGQGSENIGDYNSDDLVSPVVSADCANGSLYNMNPSKANACSMAIRILSQSDN